MKKTPLALFLELKALDTPDGSGRLEGYAAVFGNVDRVKEVIEQGAFVNLSDFIRDGWGSFDHFGTKFPICTVVDARQDQHGLYVVLEFHSTKEAQEARTVIMERLARGKRVGMSIFYRVLEDEFRNNIRYLKRLEIFEAGAVTLPANPEAGVLDAKGLPGPNAIDNPTDAETVDATGLYLRYRQKLAQLN